PPSGLTLPAFEEPSSAANPKFGPQLPRVRLRTSGSKRHWNYRVASALRSRSSQTSVPQNDANFGIGALVSISLSSSVFRARLGMWAERLSRLAIHLNTAARRLPRNAPPSARRRKSRDD